MTHVSTGKPLAAYVFEEMGFVLGGEPCLQVLERSATIEYFGHSKARLRGGFFHWEDCLAFVVLCAVGQVVRFVYSCWLNYHDDFDRQVYAALESRNPLVVRFFGSNSQLSRIFVVEHSLGERIERAKPLLESLPPWTAERHAETVSRVNSLHGERAGLWRHIGEKSDPIILI